MWFFSQDLQVLGHRITPTGRFPTTKGTEAISALPRPKNVSGVKRFQGMVGYFREYIRDMSNRTKHLRALLRKGTPFKWTSAHDAEFADLKQALCLQRPCFIILIRIALLSYIPMPQSMVSGLC